MIFDTDSKLYCNLRRAYYEEKNGNLFYNRSDNTKEFREWLYGLGAQLIANRIENEQYAVDAVGVCPGQDSIIVNNDSQALLLILKYA